MIDMIWYRLGDTFYHFLKNKEEYVFAITVKKYKSSFRYDRIRKSYQSAVKKNFFNIIKRQGSIVDDSDDGYSGGDKDKKACNLAVEQSAREIVKDIFRYEK